jgi:hypothetical protein
MSSRINDASRVGCQSDLQLEFTGVKGRIGSSRARKS